MKKQHFDETYGLNAPENYERFFVPVLGEPIAQGLVRKAALRPGERVLDVACGTGIVARLASQRVGESGSVTGLDINPGMLAVARSVAPPDPDRPIEWIESGAEAMPLQDEAFDAVLCQMGLQFMEDKSAALKEIYRVLVAGGRLFLNVPGPAGDLFANLSEVLGRHIGPEAAGFVHHVFSLNDSGMIRNLLTGAGFRDTGVTVTAKNKLLPLPAPKDFLWQYIYSTPLAGVLAEEEEDTRAALEAEVVNRWQKFVDDGAFIYEQRIITASAVK